MYLCGMKPIRHHIYTRAFHRWYVHTYGHERARGMPRLLILTLEMMRLRSEYRHVRLLINDPGYRLGPWLLAYARWIAGRIDPGADPLVMIPGPRHLRINRRNWPGLRFRSMLRPDAIRGLTTRLGLVVCADACGQRPWGRDLFWRTRAALTGMVDIRGSMLIYHGDATSRRHHFRQAWHDAIDNPGSTPFLTYDALHPEAVIAQLMRYRRELSGTSTAEATAEARPRIPRQAHPKIRMDARPECPPVQRRA